MSVRKINVSKIEYNTNDSLPHGTLWFDEQNLLRISDGVTNNGKVLIDTAYIVSQGITPYSNANVAAYLIENPQVGSTYGDGNVAAYLPTYAGNIELGNITSGSYSWQFSNNGTLTVPGTISSLTTSQVGSILSIATNIDGGDVGWSSQALSVVYDADIISTYTAGSTITFQDNTVATITQIENYSYYIDISWDTPKIGTLFPITLKTSNYAAAVAATIKLIPDPFVENAKTWTFDDSGHITLPTGGKIGSYGMGWTGITNGEQQSPISIAYTSSNVNYVGQTLASIDMYGGNQEDTQASINITTGSVNGSFQWIFNETGGLRFPNDTVQTTAYTGNIPYTPNSSNNWNDVSPTSVGEALDRISVLLKTLNGGVGP